ncbi:hypothetical protein Ait01nite_093170 [Actinoplanes italicus]|uniref:DUF2269 domain-containing protein n=1 Tax=Actinoplanes italicus TaxID=113567 RepID=A0A2T0JQ51_9ACTN|nr:DUF2269 domain-containing protein [Actinoplanes italicus]PRX09758.1 hypothetical protein CLV67_13534 [Actinoplanes italicus]GIE36272.1 hypothetical protein Ait01nite_093170 [Actinoplanes italicus]
MTLPAGLRRAGLVLHIAASVGWLGAVAASLAMAGLAVTADDPRMANAVYLLLDPLGWYVLVPFGIASLVTGVTQSLITVWGLVRHYWVVIKLVLTALAVAVLLLYTSTLGALAAAATAAAHGGPPVTATASPLVHAAGAAILLLVALALSVYKPRGLTPIGHRRRRPAATG